MADSGIRTNFSSTFVNERVPIKFPYILISDFGEELPLMVECAKPGELPIVLMHHNVPTQVGTCALSAFELEKFARIYHYEFVMSDTERRTIYNITDIMEVISWMLSSSSSSS